MNIAIKIGAAAALASLTGSAFAAPILVADSVADFGGLQGENGWHYGYYNLEDINVAGSSVSVNNSDFRQLSAFDSATSWWGVNTDSAGGNPANGSSPGSYAVITRSRMHANAPWPTSNVVAEPQWTSRRWVSDMTGEVNLSGLIAHHEYLGINMVGDGTIAHILVDGQSIYNYDVALFDLQGTIYSLDVDVVQGTVIEMVLGAKNDPMCDATTFTMRVTTLVPSPGSAAMLGMGGLLVGGRRRR
jgi:uncharacterized protein (TIGR03382 family)|tara:strand:+ start:506 stop:1240 length:735 start_codon:yes stop_codon:yes gene_type:complete